MIVGCCASVIVGLILLLAFVLSKRFLIQVETPSGRFIGVRFRASVLGHLSIDLDAAAKAVGIINSLIAQGSVP